MTVAVVGMDVSYAGSPSIPNARSKLIAVLETDTHCTHQAQEDERSQYPHVESQLQSQLDATDRKLKALRALAPVDARLQVCRSV